MMAFGTAKPTGFHNPFTIIFWSVIDQIPYKKAENYLDE